MKNLIYLLILSVALASCHSPKETIVPPERIVTQVEKVIEVRWDTTYIEVPAQSAQTTTPDSVSHLETDFATSEAIINPDGTLYHDLKNKPQKCPTVVPTTVQRVDSIVEHKVPVVVYRDKPPNKFDQFKIDAFKWLLIVILALIAIVFRKQIKRIAM